MIILTAAALAAAQPAPAPRAPAAPTAGHHADHAAHGQMQHGENCPCCDHGGSHRDPDCCDRAQHRGHDERR